ncbi:translocator protein-like [Limulus polyphemus]|uniref:Translocator protein-like n=1 Tax=Limulus polyphemus TaxID=6850 RepID=A0ABM1BYP7_LIMPO|nr:translocator protein-like [Limulus polyphemus]
MLDAGLPITALHMVIPHIGGIAAAIITRPEIYRWYKSLKKPKWHPPKWVFRTAWGLLYTEMGYASYLIWRDGGGFGGHARLPLMLYGTQLALNWAWTPLFFGAHCPGMAFVDITILMGFISGCIYTFWSINRYASYFMIPYLAWVTFGSALNFRVWRDNRMK